MMSNPNLGPELSDSSDPGNTESNRRGNPASSYLDETPSRVIEAAQARAATVSHRFGGTRYALTRPAAPSASPEQDASSEEGASSEDDAGGGPADQLEAADDAADDAAEGQASAGRDEPDDSR
jgi:hypothetical protein